jgi:hypothetical protein
MFGKQEKKLVSKTVLIALMAAMVHGFCCNIIFVLRPTILGFEKSWIGCERYALQWGKEKEYNEIVVTSVIFMLVSSERGETHPNWCRVFIWRSFEAIRATIDGSYAKSWLFRFGLTDLSDLLASSQVLHKQVCRNSLCTKKWQYGGKNKTLSANPWGTFCEMRVNS